MEKINYKVYIETEHEVVRGNASATGNDIYDKKVEDEILERLHNGDTTAWCCVVVIAEFMGYSYTEVLGCCSIKEGITVEDYAENMDLFNEAKAGLIKEIRGIQFKSTEALAKIKKLGLI
jgi:hypothetical protein